MWLDRLAGQTNPSPSSSQPGSRPYSPLPRRTSSSLSPYITSQKSGHTPRGSSISLVSNDSNTSLLAGSRKVNGSGLKQSQTVDSGPDSLEILEKLLGTKVTKTHSSSSAALAITADDLELDFDFSGLTLQELANHQTLGKRGPKGYKSQTIEDCTVPPFDNPWSSRLPRL
jgi:vacuolar protein sorting-associated protein 52